MQILGVEEKPVIATKRSSEPLSQSSVRFRAATSASDAFLVSQPRKLTSRQYKLDNREGRVADLLNQGALIAGAGGLMGSGIAANFQLAHGRVGVMEQTMDGADKAKIKLETNMAIASKNRSVIHPRDYPNIKRLLGESYAVASNNLESLKRTDFGPPYPGWIMEAIFEDATQKKRLLKHMSELFPEAILTTNTSSIDPKELATVIKDPQRFAVAHYFKLADRNKLLELGRVEGKTPETSTSDKTIDTLTEMAWALGKVPVICQKASPGFIANRMLIATGMEAARVYDEGWGKPEEIDLVAKQLLWPNGLGIKEFEKDMMPPFKMFKEYSNLGYTIAKNLSGLSDPFYSLPQLLQNESARVAATSGAKYFDKGYPEPTTPFKADVATDVRLAKIKQRLLGAMFISAQQIVEEGLAKPEDVERSAQIGFLWAKGPYGKMQELGVAEANRIIDAVKADHQSLYLHSVKAPHVSDEQLNLKWVDTKVRQDGVMFITMNRPGIGSGILQGANALNAQMLKDIRQAVNDAKAANQAKKGSVRAIVIQSNGYKEFSAGAELNEIKARAGNLQGLKDFIQLGRDTMDTIANSEVPVIAKVSGTAAGGGMEIILACHRVIMDKDAKLMLPEVNLGLIPAWGGTERLAQKAGKPFALQFIRNGKAQLGLVKNFGPLGPLILNTIKRLDMDKKSGTLMDAKTAYELGIADYVSNRKHLTDTLEELLDPKHQTDFALKKPDAMRGLDMKVSDYASSIRAAFKLKQANGGMISRTWQKWVKTGRNNQNGWELVGKLVNASGTPEQGKISDVEMVRLMHDGATKIGKVENLLQLTLEMGRDKSSKLAKTPKVMKKLFALTDKN